MRPLVIATLLVAAVGCSSAGSEPSSISTAASSTTTPTSATTVPTSSTLPTFEPCPRVPFLPTHLPAAATGDPPLSADLDRFSGIPGTTSLTWFNPGGEPVLAIVRGTLPPEQWPETPAVIRVRNFDAALGSQSGGVTAVAWVEGPDRCDEYTVVAYPGTTREELVLFVEGFVP